MSRCHALLVLLFAVLSPGQAPWAQDSTITYQGRLDAGGAPHSGTVEMHFRLYNQATGGSAQGPLLTHSVEVNEGLFQVDLDFGAAVFDSSPRWLQITIGSQTLQPRQAVRAVPTALYALSSPGGGGGPWSVSGSDVFYTGGNVGIGTATPDFPLHVVTNGPEAVIATSLAASGSAVGGSFASASTGGAGVSGLAAATSGTTAGGRFTSASTEGAGVVGLATASSGPADGVLGSTSSPSGFGVFSVGPIGATGTKSFVIDHPHDPENQYLLHFSAEGPEPYNFYRGNAVLDSAGEARVELPDYFEDINRDYQYQLTAIGAPAPYLHVAEEIHGNAFMIAGGEPSMKVSWTVTAVRDDAWMRHYPASDTREKPEHLRGTYQHPELYGQPAERGEMARYDRFGQGGDL